MFKDGDVVICLIAEMSYIVVGKQYVVQDVYGNHLIRLNDDEDNLWWYNGSNFKLDTDYYRKLKLEKICSKLVIK